jgi:hypothetical protein
MGLREKWPEQIGITFPIRYGISPTDVTNIEFLLKFSKDRDCWMDWLFEAKKRFGLQVFNYGEGSF